MNFTFFTKGLRVREEEVKYYLKVNNKNTADTTNTQTLNHTLLFLEELWTIY